jgi:hypothetical protein
MGLTKMLAALDFHYPYPFSSHLQVRLLCNSDIILLIRFLYMNGKMRIKNDGL